MHDEHAAIKQRQKLFDLYAANMQNFAATECEGLFGCPICQRAFRREDCMRKDGLQSLLNIAHAFPESCGGSIETLTCRACNDRMALLEPEMAKARKYHISMAKLVAGKKLVVRSDDDRGDLQAEVHVNPSTGVLHQKIRTRYSNPASIAGLIAITGGMPYPTTIRIPGGDQNTCHVVALHAAYLMLFYTFGYAYLLACDTEWIRQILMNAQIITTCPTILCEREVAPEVIETAGIVQIENLRAAYAMLPPLAPNAVNITCGC